MIRTKTQIFIQRFNIELQSLHCYVNLMQRWNDEDVQDELMLDAALDVVNRIGELTKEISSLQSHEWSALYNELEAVREAEKVKSAGYDASSADSAACISLTTADTDMPEDFAITGCKEVE